MNTARAVSPRELLIIGAGGFGAVAARTAESMNAAAIELNGTGRWVVIGYADCDTAKRGTRHAGRVVHGTIEEAGRAFHGRALWFFCAIGDNNARAEMVRRALEFGWRPATLIHPSAVLDSSAEIGAGTFVGPLVVAAWNAKIGAHVVIDAHVSIGHNAVLMDFCEVFAGARINGNSQVGEYALVGCNGTLLPGTLVGRSAVVGANSLAHGVVAPDTTIVGNPPRVIRRGMNLFSSKPPTWTAMEANHGEDDDDSSREQ
jgi:sugar O-acyltransferase (sialic acid O-acetyltransferase NeuD family)